MLGLVKGNLYDRVIWVKEKVNWALNQKRLVQGTADRSIFPLVCQLLVKRRHIMPIE